MITRSRALILATSSEASAALTCLVVTSVAAASAADAHDLFVAVGLRQRAHVLDRSSSTATVLSTAMRARIDVGDLLLLDLDLLVARDAAERDLALAADHLELARLLDALVLDRDLALLVLRGDGDAALLGLVGDRATPRRS